MDDEKVWMIVTGELPSLIEALTALLEPSSRT
ncbi:MAG: hypothetical protein K2X49_28800 [Acetobacteraceae bacterium]|nr:hypothetical protein [Acetobacteraceae bacterium]